MKSRSTIFALALVALMMTSLTTIAQSNKPSCCDIKSDMRFLWEDHIVWTRMVILNIIDELPGTNEAVARLLQNQEDIGNAIKPYYGNAAGNQLTLLLKDHIIIAADILNALDDGDNAALTTAIAQWSTNADDIATFLSNANPNWPLMEMKMMMRAHLDATTAEALARKNGDFAADAAAYDEVHRQIIGMADMLADGIVRQFPSMFNGCPGGKNITMDHSTMRATMSQNAPNPVHNKTVISYYIPSNVKKAALILYDNMGNTINTYEIHTRGEGQLEIEGTSLRKGLYKYSIFTDGRLVDTKTLIR